MNKWKSFAIMLMFVSGILLVNIAVAYNGSGSTAASQHFQYARCLHWVADDGFVVDSNCAKKPDCTHKPTGTCTPGDQSCREDDGNGDHACEYNCDSTGTWQVGRECAGNICDGNRCTV